MKTALLVGAALLLLQIQYRLGCDCSGSRLAPVPEDDAGAEDAGEADAGDSGAPLPQCSDGLDNDGDGLIDFPEDPGCTDALDNDESNPTDCDAGDVQPCGSTIGVCTQGLRSCVNLLWSGCDGGVRPAPETCNGLDDDCNGVTDDGIFEACIINACGGVRACVPDAGVADAGVYTACVPLSATPEVCNGLDDNCNGQIDEGLNRPCYTGPTGTRGVGLCADGSETCSAGVWGPACPGQVLPSVEICGNGLDENCNGPADDVCDGGSGDAGAGDAGGCTTAGTWNVDGGPVAYTCALGLVNISISQFPFVNGVGSSTITPQPTWSPGATLPLAGPLVSCPSGVIDAGVTYAGACTERYDLRATVTGPNSFSGVFTMTYTGSCLDCVNQSVPVRGWR